MNYQAIASLPNMGPGSSGASVQALQSWLVANGFMTQAQMNSGPGTYGPQTTAAVAKWQSSAGINTQGNPGYFGPISKTYIQSQAAPAPAAQQPAPAMSLPFTPPSNSGTTAATSPSVPQPQGSPSGNTSAAPLSIASPQSSTAISAASLAGLPNLGPGSSGAQVQQLQQWLVQNGYMTQAQMDTGPGTYGPQTTAAVSAWQKANGIDTQGNPGYFGPISKNFLTTGQASAPAGGGTPAPAGGGTTASPATGGSPSAPAGGGDASATGNPQLDAILKSLQGLIDSNKAVIPPGLQITPQLTAQFLTWAHQAVDPQTQQLIQSELANINSSLQNMQTQYEASKGQAVQDFGTNLATEQNAAGGSGTAFSGQRNLNEANLAASTNRTLASLGANYGYNVGSAARASAANVGAGNAGGINIPTLAGATVSQFGGSRGSSAAGPSLDFSYNPSIYTAGTIPTNQNTAVNNLAGNYLNQYTTLAGANSGRSMSSLIGGITGLPAGYTIPAGLT